MKKFRPYGNISINVHYINDIYVLTDEDMFLLQDCMRVAYWNFNEQHKLYNNKQLKDKLEKVFELTKKLKLD